MKTTLIYDKYFTQADRTAGINTLIEKYPDIISVESICKTLEGKDVYALTITGKTDRKP